MSHKLNSAIAVIGIDIGKNSFHVVGHDKRGAITLRQKWSSAMVAAIGTGDAFSKGRDFGAWSSTPAVPAQQAMWTEQPQGSPVAAGYSAKKSSISSTIMQ